MVDITEISAIVAAAGVLVGVVFTVLQVRDLVKTRQSDMVMRLYATYGSTEFQEALGKIMMLDFVDFADFMKKYAADVGVGPALVTVGTLFEGIGVLVKRKLISMDLVDDLFASSIRVTWEKMAPLMKGMRELTKTPSNAEWFEYLYNEMKKREQQQASKTA